MTASPRPGRARVAFDEPFWTHDLACATPAGRRAAQAWRAEAERDGVAIGELRPCQAEGPDGTQLPLILMRRNA